MHDRQVTLPVPALRVPTGLLLPTRDGGQNSVLGKQPGHLAVVVHHGVFPSFELGQEVEKFLPFRPFRHVGTGGLSRQAALRIH